MNLLNLRGEVERASECDEEIGDLEMQWQVGRHSPPPPSPFSSSSPTTAPPSSTTSPNPWVVGAAWFFTSAVCSTWANMAFLNFFGSALGHTAVRFVGATTLSFFALGPQRSLTVLRRGFLLAAQPSGNGLSAIFASPFAQLGLLLFMANFLNSVSLSTAGITLTYTVKAAIPVFTVAAMVILTGARYSRSIYASLVPTVCGVALASASDASFHALGLSAALGSCASQTLLNIGGRGVQERTKVSGFETFFLLATAASAVALPLFLLAPVLFPASSSEEERGEGAEPHPAVFGRVAGGLTDVGRLLLRALFPHSSSSSLSSSLPNAAVAAVAAVDDDDDDLVDRSNGGGNESALYESEVVVQEGGGPLLLGSLLVEAVWPLVLVVAAALAYQAEYALNFVFVGLVDPVTFSVLDIGRRLAVIVTGAVLFDKPLTPLNIGGIGLALAGVLAYSVLSKQPRAASASAGKAMGRAMGTAAPNAPNQPPVAAAAIASIMRVHGHTLTKDE